MSSFFIFPPIFSNFHLFFHISTLFSYIASDHDESTYVELFTTSRSLISNYFMLDWFLRISNLTLLRLFTVRVFSLFCTRFFSYFRLFFFKFPPIFFKFPPIFSYFLPCFHILLRMMFMRSLELYMMSWSIDFNPFISCNASTALNRAFCMVFKRSCPFKRMWPFFNLRRGRTSLDICLEKQVWHNVAIIWIQWTDLVKC